MTLALILNPTSGGGKGLSRGLAATEILRPLISHRSNSYEDTLLAGDNAAAAGCRVIAACGGDGMMHAVIQGCVKHDLTLLPIPAGTGNDFVRALGWDLEEIETQLNAVVSTPPAAIDLGLVDSEWFGAVLSTGFDSIVNEKANTLKWPRGPMKYNLAIAMELPKFKPLKYIIELDNQVIETEAMLIAVGNGGSYGGGMKVCPDAVMNDGLFDVMVLRPVSKVEFVRVFPTVFSGKHVAHKQVDIYRTMRVSLHAPAIAYADGERIGGLPVRAECIAGAGLSWTP